MKILFASSNKNKIKEIKDILNNHEIISLNELNIKIDIIEDGQTFKDNALKKAQTIYNITNIPTIADDSGLCIEALNNWPGVMTKRFIKGTDKERNIAIINKLKNINNKKAIIKCNLVYYNGKDIIDGVGQITGKIVNPRGENGFGFDPIFELKNGQTLAQLSSKEKNKCSARYLACLDLKEKIKNISPED